MGMCGERNVSLTFLTENGRFLGKLLGPVSGNVLLRREQYRRADDPDFCSLIAMGIVCAKISNSRSVLQRVMRDHPDKVNIAALKVAIDRLSQIIDSFAAPVSLDTIRGREGEAARIYFSQFDQLIVAQKRDFFFHERSRRPPLDNMNALLSFIYTLVTNDIASSLEAVGLDPAVGFLHKDRPGRPGLALDLMEEFRPFLADRLVLSLVNRKQVTGKGFANTESGAVRMNDSTRKTLLSVYQERKRDEIFHPFIEERVPIGLLPHVQAMLLARCLREEMDGYPPFFWR
jgi:CRISPR-associated protein Cas1